MRRASPPRPCCASHLSQAVFERVYLEDDEIAGVDLTSAYRRLLADDLATEPRREAVHEEEGRS